MQNSSTTAEERKKVGMLIPPPVLLITLSVASGIAQYLSPTDFTFSVPLAIIGTALIAVSLALVFACGRIFKNAGTPFRPISPTTVIVRTGPYRFSRNPMYVGMLGLLAGLGFVLGSYYFVAAWLIFAVVIHFGVVLPEERYLESLHGEAYRQYKRQVRRWI